MADGYKIICNDDTICPPDWGMTDEAATFHRIYYVSGGEAWCRYRSRQFLLKPQTLYLFPVRSPYSMGHNPADPFRVLWFHVETAQPLCSEIRAISVAEGSALYHVLECLRAMNGQPQLFQEFQDTMGILLRLLTQHMFLEHADSRQMQEIVDYVNIHVSSADLSVDALASHVNMDRASFSRKFKQYFHLSPGQFIFEKKMNCAAQALTDGASIYEAATQAGYLDEKSFSRAFKRYTESSPAEYRKKRAILP